MIVRVQLLTVLRLSLAVFLGVLPLACLVLYVTAIDSYWNYYEMGINEDANMLGFFLFHTPIMLTILYGGFVSCWLTMHHFQRPVWQTFLAVILIYVLVILAAFFLEVAQTADDRTSIGKNLSMFFQAYFEQWSIFLRNKL